MKNKQSLSENKTRIPVLAICYDFDKTLTPDDMQAHGYIQSLDKEIKEFWDESNSLAQNNDMDQNLAYLYLMVKKSYGRFYVTREMLEEFGAKVILFPGVDSWFKRIREYGEEKGIQIEHYIISSGLQEMIEGTQMAKNGDFKKIYASSFYYNEEGVAEWPAQVINYTNKTQFLFRIEKGCLDVNDDRINRFYSPDEMRVPFRNIVYVGDSATDIPCMKLVNTYGGHSIGVYNPETADKSKVYEMMEQNRIKYFTPADYREGTELDVLIKCIIDRTAANEVIEEMHNSYRKEAESNRSDQIQNRKNELLYDFIYSRSYASTHAAVEDMKTIDSWNEYQLRQIYHAAMTNAQIRSILMDRDVKCFIQGLLSRYSYRDSKADQLVDLLES